MLSFLKECISLTSRQNRSKTVSLRTFCTLASIQFQTPFLQPQRYQNASQNTSSTNKHFFEHTQVCFPEVSTTHSGFGLHKRFALPLKCTPVFKLQVHRPTASQTRTKRVTVLWVVLGPGEVFLCFVLWLSVLLCRQSSFSSLYTWFPSPRSLLNANVQNVLIPPRFCLDVSEMRS